MATPIVPIPIRAPVAAIYDIEKRIARRMSRASPREAAELAAYRDVLDGRLAEIISRWQRGEFGMDRAIAELGSLADEACEPPPASCH